MMTKQTILVGEMVFSCSTPSSLFNPLSVPKQGDNDTHQMTMSARYFKQITNRFS